MDTVVQFEILMACTIVLGVVCFSSIFYLAFTSEQRYEDFCETTLVYNNGEHWCLNEDDEKLYAIGCGKGSLFDNQSLNCYYKSNLVKEAG